jgi:hypothetical protein
MDKLFAQFANGVAHIAGNPVTFLTRIALVVVWAASGPFFGFSETWQLVINGGFRTRSRTAKCGQQGRLVPKAALRSLRR